MPKHFSPQPLEGKVFIRATIFHYVGEVVHVGPLFVELNPAAWVADPGIRLSEFLGKGNLVGEFETYPGGAFVALSQIQDIAPWNGTIP